MTDTVLNRYWVFAGSDDCPLGGWNDFKGNHASLADAMEYATRDEDGEPVDWAHIVDGETGNIMYRWTFGYGWRQETD